MTSRAAASPKDEAHSPTFPAVDLRAFYPTRPEESRKGDFGRVLVVGGSERYAGACAFNALAALRAGADLAHVVAPRRAADLVAGYGPDLITIPCDAPFPEPHRVAELAKSADALVIGGGVERSAVAHKAMRMILAALDKPAVIDAEALHALAGHDALVAGKPVLLTPHGGEFEALTGSAWPSEAAARESAAKACARRYGATVIVKGRREIVTDGARIAVDEAGSPFLTKGGYGDLLAGAAAAQLARGASPMDAARVAARLVGRAGEMAAEALGESTLASDTLARIPQALAEGLRVR